MKQKFTIVFAAFSLSISTISAQTPQKEKQTQASQACQSATAEINRLTEEINSSFKQNKFNEAYSSSKKAFDLTETACPEEKAKRLAMAVNLAEIQIKRGKSEEAAVVLKNNLSLAEAVYGENSAKLDAYLNYLIALSADSASDEEFEQYALKSLKVRRAVFGDESYETMTAIHRIAGFYDRQKKFEKAEDYYLQAIAIHDKLPQNEKTKKIHVVNNYRVFLIKSFGKEGRTKDAEFMKRRTADMSANGETGGILNGRAISLPNPPYPPGARPTRASGTVEVTVTIGESGDVIKAKAVSGNQYLRQAAVSAAKAAKFLPTYVNGQAVQVTGVIVYNFVP